MSKKSLARPNPFNFIAQHKVVLTVTSAMHAMYDRGADAAWQENPVACEQKCVCNVNTSSEAVLYKESL